MYLNACLAVLHKANIRLIATYDVFEHECNPHIITPYHRLIATYDVFELYILP